MATESPRHEPKTFVNVLADILRVWDLGDAILSEGQFHDGELVRMGLLSISSGKPDLIWDDFVNASDIETLERRLRDRGPIVRGRIDFMYATDWKVAWTEEDERCRVFDRRGLRVDANSQRLIYTSRLGRMSIAAADIAAVRARGGAFRARTAVEIESTSRRRTLVSAWDIGNWLSDDPWEIYEQWPTDLATRLANLYGIEAADELCDGGRVVVESKRRPPIERQILSPLRFARGERRSIRTRVAKTLLAQSGALAIAVIASLLLPSELAMTIFVASLFWGSYAVPIIWFAWLYGIFIGRIPKDKSGWHVDVDANELNIVSPRAQTRVCLDEIDNARVVLDNSLGGSRGLAEGSLWLGIEGGEIPVPSKFAGWRKLVEYLNTNLEIPVTTRVIDP